MTEYSYFHNSTAGGHADQAPYDQELYASLTSALYDADGTWVLPNQLNNLLVATSANMVISIATGRAIIYGYWFENDGATTLTIANNTSAYARWDMIVAQIDTETGTASFASIQGAPGATLSIPVCNTCDTIKQLPLALVYVASGAVAIAAGNIYDQRLFLNNAYHRNAYTTQNDFPNGLFIAWGDSENTGTTRRPMPGWRPTGTHPATKDALRFDWMPYGRCVQFYGSATNYDTQLTLQTYTNSTDAMTFTMWAKVNSGTLAVSFAGTSKTFYACKDMYHIIFHASVTGNQVLSLTTNGTATDIVVGDLRLAQGWCEAEMKSDQHAEIVLFDKPVLPNRDVANFTEPTLTGRSTGDFYISWSQFGHMEDVYPVGGTFNSSINLVEGYSAPAYILQVRANDSGSAAGASDIWLVDEYMLPILMVWLQGVVNDKFRYTTAIVDTMNNQNSAHFACGASGAGTLDVALYLLGMVI